MQYVCGFAFAQDHEQVVLMRKLKPADQRGRWNGLGGKIESSDKSARHAMSREFLEESGVDIDPDRWNVFCCYNNADGSEVFFLDCLICLEELERICSMEEEKVFILDYPDCTTRIDLMDNLRWLLPLALDDTTRGVIANEYT